MTRAIATDMISPDDGHFSLLTCTIVRQGLSAKELVRKKNGVKEMWAMEVSEQLLFVHLGSEHFMVVTILLRLWTAFGQEESSRSPHSLCLRLLLALPLARGLSLCLLFVLLLASAFSLALAWNTVPVSVTLCP